MERLFLRIKDNWDKGGGAAVFCKALKGQVMVVLPANVSRAEDVKKACFVKGAGKDSCCGSGKGVEGILFSVRKSRKSGNVEQFMGGDGNFGLCCPVLEDDTVLGFLVVCGIRRKVASAVESALGVFVDVSVKAARKEIELEDVNKTIRPRVIALSTVHTVHRLMTSSLDLNDLLPRIARLSLQVIRANRCSIKIVDGKRKVLIPKATIDLRKKETKLKKVQIGKYAPGKAVKMVRPIRSDNYLATPMVDEDVVGVITLYDKLDGQPFTQFDEEIMKTMCEQAAIAIKNAQLFKEQTDVTLGSIKCIAHLLENRPHGSPHAEASFLKLMHIIGRKFNMNEGEINMLQCAATLHDAGQISVPEKELMKKGGLTGEEYDMVKMHPSKGSKILSKFKPLKPIVPIILHHHENYDGTGYPRGLRGEGIPLAARILGVVSAFEAMITEKPYRKPLSIEAAVKEVGKHSGRQFDPQVVKVFCEAVCRKDVMKLLRKELGRQ